MPAVSKKQRRFFGMMEHNPGMAKAKGIKMTKSEMHDFAATPEKGLPMKKKMMSEDRKFVKRMRGK